MKQFLFSLIIFITISSYFSTKANANQFMGGEITWECIPSGQVNAGKYIFTMKLYHECYTYNGFPTTGYPNALTLNSNSPAGNIPMTIVTGWPKDISPVCNSDTSFTHIQCTGMPNGAGNMGACQEYIYKSAPVYLGGIPQATGWMFYWGSCCRNPSTNIVNSSSLAHRLRAIMYPYGTQNTYPCFNNSSEFAENPRTVLETGYEFSYNNMAYDMDYDSISFEWGQPLGMNGVPIGNYTNGYSYNSPLPGTIQNANNIPATIDSNNGQIHFKSFTPGTFITSVKVTEFRDGIKIAEIWREMHLVLRAGSTNAPPVLTQPFVNGTSYDTVVVAGSLVGFLVSVTDFQYLSNSSPQTVYMKQFSSQFGDFIPPPGTNQPTLSSTTGCLNPPCATLTPASGPNAPISGVFGVQTSFSWQTNCGHLLRKDSSAQNMDTVYYRFLFSVQDDNCPVPGQGTNVITIGLIAGKKLDAPNIDSAYLNYATNEVHLSWQPVIDSTNSFKAYYIYYSPTFNGNYTLIDSTLSLNATSYLHVLNQAQNAYYKIRTKSANSCNQWALSDFSNVISLDVTGLNKSVNQKGFVLYPNEPNPADSYTFIKFYTKEPANVKLVLIDISGRIVERKEFMSVQGDNSYNLPIENLNAGVYYITLYYKEQRRSNKLMVK